MPILDQILKFEPSSDLRRSLVKTAGEICKLKFQTNKKIIIRGIAEEDDIGDLMKTFRSFLNKMKINNEHLCDKDLFDHVITHLDQMALKKNI